jgi:hypothetical protein
MIVLGYIGMGMLFFLFVLAKGAIRFDIGPQWLRRFIIDNSANSPH